MAPIKIEKILSSITLTESLKDEDDDDCVILDGDPNKPLTVSAEKNSTEEDLFVIAEKGQVACRDYPHARHLCATVPFDTTSHSNYCEKCHCYVCDTPAPCVYWSVGTRGYDHCHSHDKHEYWKLKRECMRNKQQVCTSEKEERVIPGKLEDKLTGIIVFFDKDIGYGSIFPDNGSENLVFLHSSVGKECDSYKQGEKVEFQIEIGEYGVSKAINVRVVPNSFDYDYYNPVKTLQRQYLGREYYHSSDPTLINSSSATESNQSTTGSNYKGTSTSDEYQENIAGRVDPHGDTNSYYSRNDGSEYYHCGETGNFTGDYYYGGGETGNFTGDYYYGGGETVNFTGDYYYGGGETGNFTGDYYYGGGETHNFTGDYYYGGGVEYTVGPTGYNAYVENNYHDGGGNYYTLGDSAG